LKLKGFTNLEVLNCSNNQLTDLDLRECKTLTKVKCDKNNFENLNFLIRLANLKGLDISDCPKLQGSLKPLKDLKKLERVNVSRTNINEGLEDLPASCQELICDLDYGYSSVEIAKQLREFSEGKGKYSLNKWGTDKQNSVTASAVPLERLFVIRNNLKQFFNK
jgi:Leucine-rich repeat (LRR) protein